MRLTWLTVSQTGHTETACKNCKGPDTGLDPKTPKAVSSLTEFPGHRGRPPWEQTRAPGVMDVVQAQWKDERKPG